DSRESWAVPRIPANVIKSEYVFVARPLSIVRDLRWAISDFGLCGSIGMPWGVLLALRPRLTWIPSASVVWRDWRHDGAIRKNAWSNQRPQQHRGEANSFKEN
ncbi:MAG TPA: hypothetical protein VJW93_03385, partial [Candidatus Acidoferrales bacterium]|nr:hypothetical protein [Candidatus Acidoferrales bacterium]